MFLSRYVKIYNSPTNPEFRLLYSTKRASLALIRLSALSALQADSLPDEQQQTLLRLGMVVADPEQERREMAGFFHRVNDARSVFTAVLVLNLDCNLACTYCFERDIRAQQYMSREVADRFIEHVNAKNFQKTKEVKVEFYGGEPLLSLDMIVYVSERLKNAADKSGFVYSFFIVTNGTLLTARTVEKLLPLGLKGATITLDGPKETHDAARPFVGGKGSFNRIVANLSDICGMMSVQLGGNYTVENYRSFPRLLDDLTQKGITPDKVAVVKFAPVAETRRRQGSSPELGNACGSLFEEWLYDASVFLREEILKRGYRSPKITPLTCAVELEDDMVINIDGSIYKCSGMLGHKEFAIGTIQDGISDCNHIYCLDRWKNPECLECAYLPLCFGGCRFESMLRTGSLTGVICLKPYFDASLETLINQEIKYKQNLFRPSKVDVPPGSV